MEPKIRLKGFSGEWKKVKLENIYTLSAAGDLRKDLFSPTKDINHPYPIFSNSLENAGLYGYSSEYRYEKDALTITGRGTLGHAEYRTECFDAIIRLLILQPKKEICNIFVKEYINHKSPFVYESTGVPQLTIPQIKDIEIPIPPNKEEQRQIATFFTSLDNQISAAEKRLASLKQVKAASLQAMFPQEGETTPKLRFKGWEGEWKKVKLGEMYEPRNEKNDLSFGVNDIISVANMYFRPISYVSNDDYLKSYNIFRVGDIAFEGHKSKNFSHGRFVENSIGDGIVSHVFVVLKRKDKQFDVDFWKYYINNERIMCGILTRSTKSSTMMNDIVVSDFLKESILVPSYEEQVKIGNYFTALDRQLTAQSSKISKLKQIKSACLDQMFV